MIDSSRYHDPTPFEFRHIALQSWKRLVGAIGVAKESGNAADGLRVTGVKNPASSSPLSGGFSLIEGVVLVSLVGIAAAFAVPRFTNLANKARAAEMTSLGANLRAAAERRHAQYLESGGRARNATVVGNPVSLKNGYPDATQDGIGRALFETEGFAAETTEDSVIFRNADAPSAQHCSVTYRAAASPTAAPPVTNVETTGC